jgi:hypothetical protein
MEQFAAVKADHPVVKTAPPPYTARFDIIAEPVKITSESSDT